MELEKAKAWIADLSRRLLKDKVRFAVGGPGVGYSSTWSAWHKADSSFYILARDLRSTTKPAPPGRGTLRQLPAGVYQKHYSGSVSKGTTVRMIGHW